MPMRKCPKCSQEFFTNDLPPISCAKCGTGLTLTGEALVLAASDSSANPAIILTTSYLVAGREIDREIEIITAECVYGVNILRDLFAAVRDVFGGRSASMQRVLRDARKTVLAELRKEAEIVGADAVIGIDLDYQEISGGGGMLMIVASGTAVKLKP
jgi:uncharacterized protein YbjQ (UPF0145 family)